MSRANTAELVGACAIVPETRRKLMLSDKIFRFVFRVPTAIDAGFLDHVLKSPALRSQIVAGATGTSPTMKNISKEKVLALRIPRLPLHEQKRIAARLDARQRQIDAVAKLQAESASKSCSARSGGSIPSRGTIRPSLCRLARIGAR
jgi:type I restriction enzyme, S subunit